MLAQHAGNTDAEKRLKRWADRGLPVAQRELGLLYLTKAGKRGDAMALFESAGSAGDGEAAYQRGESLLRPLVGETRDPARAWRWYRVAAEHGHAVAALNLARMAKNGDGVPVDAKLAGQWLTFASDRGNAQAMFLLSNAYMTGDGVPRNPLMARRLLEMSADKDYPVAIQALAQAVQGGDLLIPKDDLRADHLLKEATEERPNRWAGYK
ncbi:MAG: sel1 repeat family protein [Burkholderiales bacterium]|nr:sel1 repeat family protein [Burkholderiales bacterium]